MKNKPGPVIKGGSWARGVVKFIVWEGRVQPYNPNPIVKQGACLKNSAIQALTLEPPFIILTPFIIFSTPV